MGGIVAYEMARQAAAVGERIELLAVIDSRAPTSPLSTRPTDLELLATFAADLAYLSGKQLPPGALAGNTVEDAMADLVVRAQAAGVQGLGLEELGGLFAVFRANYRALNVYRPSPWMGVPVTEIHLFRASERTDSEPALGWDRLGAGLVEAHEIPGDHYSILRGEGAATMARELQRLLAH
jgi:thioesterase domain-containing protein